MMDFKSFVEKGKEGGSFDLSDKTHHLAGTIPRLCLIAIGHLCHICHQWTLMKETIVEFESNALSGCDGEGFDSWGGFCSVPVAADVVDNEVCGVPV